MSNPWDLFPDNGGTGTNPWPAGGGAVGLPGVFNTGSDVLDSLGNAYAQFRLFRLQQEYANAPKRQEILVKTVEVPQNVGAEPVSPALWDSYQDNRGSTPDQTPWLVAGAVVVLLGGVALWKLA